jgi:hypothetical protein
MHQTVDYNPRWPAIVNTLVIIGLFYTLPNRWSLRPSWLLPLIATLLLIAAVIANRMGRGQLNFFFGVAVQVSLTVVEVSSLLFLILTIPSKREAPDELLRAAAALWVSNILLFASWYWRLDAGGPHQRERRQTHDEGAFLFPQMTLPEQGTWKPNFIDYLFLAFNTSTAFSPTDTPVLSAWAKAVMMLQAAISLCIVAILLARGISLI